MLLEQDLADAAGHGVEADHRVWFLRVLLQQHNVPLVFPLSGEDKRQVYAAIQQPPDDDTEMRFVVFDTPTERIALNLAEFSFCRFLFELGDSMEDPDETAIEEVQVYFSANPTPFLFPADLDMREDGEALEEFECLFAMLSTYVERQDRLHFSDVDGEEVFLNVGTLALLVAPLWIFATEGEDAEERKPHLRLIKA